MFVSFLFISFSTELGQHSDKRVVDYFIEDHEKRDEVFQNDFDSSYELVVKLKVVQLIAFVFALAILVGLIFFTVKIIRGEM